jgi:hypothetical protein
VDGGLEGEDLVEADDRGRVSRTLTVGGRCSSAVVMEAAA